MAPSTLRVTRAWVATYDPALSVQAGDIVRVEREDDEWPGWWWSVDQTGQGGWLPGDLIDPAEPGSSRVLRPMNTLELTVKAGEEVLALTSERGWTLCRSYDGREGWVPNTCLNSST